MVSWFLIRFKLEVKIPVRTKRKFRTQNGLLVTKPLFCERLLKRKLSDETTTLKKFLD